MSKDELSTQIMKVRSDNDSNKEQILKDKADALDNLNEELVGSFSRMANGLDPDMGIKIIWNLETSKYHAEEK
jgi:hypothetical protein